MASHRESTAWREYAARDSRIRYIRQPTNLGISRNMMFLLQQGSGEFFMWAGDDDLWHRDFVKTLHEALQQNPEVASAFTPMYFVDEQGEQLSIYESRATDYSSPTAYKRIKKLMRVFDDAFGYGLFRREAIAGVQFPVWWWINKSWAGNNIYPTLCYYLAKSDFLLVGEKPMLYKRVKEDKNTHHRAPYRLSFVRGYFAFALWKFNVVTVSLNQVARAGKTWTAFRLAPSMFFRWMIVPASKELLARGARLWRGKISFF